MPKIRASHFPLASCAPMIFRKREEATFPPPSGERPMSDRNRIVRLGEVNLATRADGADGRPWIVLSSSLASTYDMWDGQIAMLTRTHQALRYDTRGHGGSSAPRGPYGFGDLVGDVVGLMDHFRIEKADLMGLSLGGMTMLGIAIDHLSRVNRVICCDARS